MHLVHNPIDWNPALPKHHHATGCACEPTIAYIRVSKVGDRQDLISPDIQLSSIVSDARTKNKRIVKVVSDIDKSGRTFLNRNVDEVIKAIEAGIAKSVTVWKWSRWGRNLNLSLTYLDAVQRVGGRVDSAADDVDQDNATGLFTRDLLMRIDQLNSDSIGEGWQAAHDQRREHGLPHSGRARFGFTYISRDKIRAGAAHTESESCESCRGLVPHFIPNAPEATALAEIYRDYVGGASFRSLTRRLNERGFRTAFGGMWTPQSLSQLMDTGFAAGLIRERSTEAKKKAKAANRRMQNRLKEFDVWREGAQDAIIDRELWAKYLARRTAQADLPPRARSAAHALSALLYCRLCSRRLTTKYAGAGRTHQWQCSWAKDFHPETAVSISNTGALSAVEAWLRDQAVASDIEDVDELAIAAMSMPSRASRTPAQVDNDIAAAMSKIDRLLRLHLDDKILEESFLLQQAEILEQVQILRAERTNLVKLSATPGKPSYEAFGSLAELFRDSPSSELQPVLSAVVGMALVSPLAAGHRRGDPVARVEVVGVWEMPSWERWLSARRVRLRA